MPLSRMLNEEQPVVRGCAGCLATRIGGSCLELDGPEQAKACVMGLRAAQMGSSCRGIAA